jgi:hypothetical protein
MIQYDILLTGQNAVEREGNELSNSLHALVPGVAQIASKDKIG